MTTIVDSDNVRMSTIKDRNLLKLISESRKILKMRSLKRINPVISVFTGKFWMVDASGTFVAMGYCVTRQRLNGDWKFRVMFEVRGGRIKVAAQAKRRPHLRACF